MSPVAMPPDVPRRSALAPLPCLGKE